MKYKLLITIRNILYFLIIIEFLLISYLTTIKMNEINKKNIKLEERLSDLEEDYKLYEINLSDLKKNAKAHLCNN